MRDNGPDVREKVSLGLKHVAFRFCNLDFLLQPSTSLEMVDVNPGLRQRASRNDASNNVKTEDIPDEAKGAVEEIVWGKTPDGTGKSTRSFHVSLSVISN